MRANSAKAAAAEASHAEEDADGAARGVGGNDDGSGPALTRVEYLPIEWHISTRGNEWRHSHEHRHTTDPSP